MYKPNVGGEENLEQGYTESLEKNEDVLIKSKADSSSSMDYLQNNMDPKLSEAVSEVVFDDIYTDYFGTNEVLAEKFLKQFPGVSSLKDGLRDLYIDGLGSDPASLESVCQDLKEYYLSQDIESKMLHKLPITKYFENANLLQIYNPEFRNQVKNLMLDKMVANGVPSGQAKELLNNKEFSSLFNQPSANGFQNEYMERDLVKFYDKLWNMYAGIDSTGGSTNIQDSEQMKKEFTNVMSMVGSLHNVDNVEEWVKFYREKYQDSLYRSEPVKPTG